MVKTNIKLLQSLMEASGVSGREFEIRKTIRKELNKHCKDIKTDKFGNLYARKKGKGGRIMLSAHMDEIGLIVKSIDLNGRIRFSEIGGIDPMSMIGQRVKIVVNGGGIEGIITTKEMSNSLDIENLPSMKDMFIDTCMNKKQLNKIGVGTGNIITFEQESGVFCSNGFVYGKALDDRIGCYILLELTKRLKKTKGDIFFVFTLQEELGLYGGKTSAYNIEPDWAIAIDVTNTDDAEENPSKILGKGPTITIKDEDMVTDYYLDTWIKKLAKKNKIPLQLDVSEGGTTEAVSVSIARGGIPATVVGVPVRNLHTTVGIASLVDIENCIKLLELIIKNSDKVKMRK